MRFRFDWEAFWSDVDECVDKSGKSLPAMSLEMGGLPVAAFQSGQNISFDDLVTITGYFSLDLMLYIKRRRK